MAKFNYTVMDRSGFETRGQIIARNQNDATAQLKKDGSYIVLLDKLQEPSGKLTPLAPHKPYLQHVLTIAFLMLVAVMGVGLLLRLFCY